MGRTVSTDLQNLLNLDRCETQTTLDLTLADMSEIHVATEAFTANSNNYAADLRVTNEIKQSIGSSPDRVIATIQNVDKVFGGTVTAEDLVKAVAQVGRYYRDPNGVLPSVWVELFRGQLRPIELDEKHSSNEILNDLAAAGYCVAPWSLSPNCQLQFKHAATCGYSGSETDCNKKRRSKAGCLGRDNEHHFGGMEFPEPIVPSPPAGGDDPPGDPPYDPPCPRLDQYVLVRGKDGLPISQPVSLLTVRDMLFNPVTETFHAIDALEIICDEPIWMVSTNNLAMCFSSGSHPIIRSLTDDRGTPVQVMHAGSSVLTWDFESGCTVATKASVVTDTGKMGDVMRIHMRDGHIYAAGHTPILFVVGHNTKNLP